MAVGFNPKRAGMFASMMPGAGEAGKAQQSAVPAIEQPVQPAETGYKPPSMLQDIGGKVADYIASYYGAAPVYEPTMAARQQEDFKMRLADAQRKGEIDKWKEQERFKRENPEPAQPTEIERLMTAAGIDVKSPQGQEMLSKAVQNKVDPPVWRQGADLQWYRVDTPQQNRPALGSVVDDPFGDGGGGGGAPTMGAYGPQTTAWQGPASGPTPQEIASIRQSLINTFGPQQGEQKFAAWKARNLGGGN